MVKTEQTEPKLPIFPIEASQTEPIKNRLPPKQTLETNLLNLCLAETPLTGSGCINKQKSKHKLLQLPQLLKDTTYTRVN